MLTNDDLQFIKNNREAIKQLRTDPVTLNVRTVAGEDPYTGEPTYNETQTVVQAIVKGFTGEVGGEHLLVNGEAIQSGDVSMTFDINVDLNGVTTVVHDGIEYVLVDVTPTGLGDENRYECVARRAT